MSTNQPYSPAHELEQNCEIDFGLLLEAIAQTHGIFAAVSFLNGMSTHHCTGLYRVDGDILTNLRVHDRQAPQLDHLPPLPLRETYCEMVVHTQAPVVIGDALLEAQLDQHPNRENIRSYAGVPIAGQGGQTWGTVCHFDAIAQGVHPHDVTRLKFFAEMVERTELLTAA